MTSKLHAPRNGTGLHPLIPYIRKLSVAKLECPFERLYIAVAHEPLDNGPVCELWVGRFVEGQLAALD